MRYPSFEDQVTNSLTSFNKRLIKLEKQVAELNQKKPVKKSPKVSKPTPVKKGYLEGGIFNHDDFTNG
jgi:hypothetical protein